jgi:PleD family two-component response regulator
VQNQALDTEAHGLLPITVSGGLVEVPPGVGADMTAAYAAIDRALYRAKSDGRNAVRVG